MKAKVEKLQHITKDLDATNPLFIHSTIRVNNESRVIDLLSIDSIVLLVSNKAEIDVTKDIRSNKFAIEQIQRQVEADILDNHDELLVYEPEEADVYANHY